LRENNARIKEAKGFLKFKDAKRSGQAKVCPVLLKKGEKWIILQYHL
jgi:hypothetical protein